MGAGEEGGGKNTKLNVIKWKAIMRGERWSHIYDDDDHFSFMLHTNTSLYIVEALPRPPPVCTTKHVLCYPSETNANRPHVVVTW